MNHLKHNRGLKTAILLKIALFFRSEHYCYNTYLCYYSFNSCQTTKQNPVAKSFSFYDKKSM